MKQSWIPQKQSLCFARHYAILGKLVQRPSRNAFLKKIQIKCGINMFRLWERYHNDVYIKNYPNYIDMLLSHVMLTWWFAYIIVLWKHLRRSRFIWLSSSARFWSIPLCWSMWVSGWAGWIWKLPRLWGFG